MAKQTSLITFTGQLGNMIGYERKGKFLLRAKPASIRQTVATRQAAQRFGLASKKGALIRSAFANELDVRCDTGRINRLNKALIQAGGITQLQGFRFNQSTGIERFFLEMPVCVNKGTLYIPPQVLPEMDGITALEVKVIGARISFSKHTVIATDAVRLVIKTGEAFAGAELPLDVPGDGVLIVTLQVRGLYNELPSGNMKYMAADIIAVELPEPKEVINNLVYPQRQILHHMPSVTAIAAYEGCRQVFVQRE
ncbi:hypothetical protein [Chitinophaga pinensis]|uniref:Uncharacterized protein n=1 Tax=Chitinophaga pinensis (strain ATCC 43595 / DSM 2588 / LMG 13176 / NBRC 15968 / NCIMB 11800 / UQM 2034) TaxID=485918 RepID=A0A979G3X1_CHIPD|nr:hypothetical protein [Chitinophaga pinensis]ACU60462.1 hypothetical protein Cpin_2986 [Chitinophaga pinensis DSM 2588]